MPTGSRFSAKCVLSPCSRIHPCRSTAATRACQSATSGNRRRPLSAPAGPPTLTGTPASTTTPGDAAAVSPSHSAASDPDDAKSLGTLGGLTARQQLAAMAAAAAASAAGAAMAARASSWSRSNTSSTACEAAATGQAFGLTSQAWRGARSRPARQAVALRGGRGPTARS